MDNAIALGLVSFFVLASSNVEAFVVPPRPSSSIQDTLKPSDPNLQHVHLSASMTIHRIFSRRGRTSFPGSVKELRATAAKSTIASPAALELQAELKRLSAGTSNGVKANPSERERIEQLARVSDTCRNTRTSRSYMRSVKYQLLFPPVLTVSCACDSSALANIDGRSNYHVSKSGNISSHTPCVLQSKHTNLATQ